jgi:hypothetical protein
MDAAGFLKLDPFSLRSYKLQDNICSQDCFQTARHTANDDPTCVSKRNHAVPLNASSAVIAAMASFSKLRRASTLNSFQSFGKRRGGVGDRKISLKPLRYVRGVHFRGECVGQSTATCVIAAQFHASLCHSQMTRSRPSINPIRDFLRAAPKTQPVLDGQLWVGEWFRKTCGSLIVICGHRNGFFESAAKLGFGWPSSLPIVVWKRKGKSHGIQA